MLVLAASAAGCASLQARGATTPALTTPPAPAPIVIPVALDADVPPMPEPLPAATTSAAPRDPAPPPARPPRPSTPVTPTVTAPPPTEPVAPPPTLETAPDATAAEIRTNVTLSTAEQNLNRVVYGRLGPDARAQYDNARGLVRMARNYLKLKNYMYAEQLADKAAAVANLLIKY